jgi:hypothetical protein
MRLRLVVLQFLVRPLVLSSLVRFAGSEDAKHCSVLLIVMSMGLREGGCDRSFGEVGYACLVIVEKFERTFGVNMVGSRRRMLRIEALMENGSGQGVEVSLARRSKPCWLEVVFLHLKADNSQLYKVTG